MGTGAPTEPAIDVVIPTFNGWELLPGCLDCLRDQTASHTAIVVDDASSDGTVDRLAEVYPEVRAVALPENQGFSRAVNAGIHAGSAEVVVLLNNDVQCRPEFLERIAAPLTEDPSVGSVAALLLQADGSTIDNVGLETDLALASFPRHWGRAHAKGGFGGTDGLLGPIGGAGAYRREALESAGGLDEAIFAYGEDADLALRMRAAGWSCAVAPDAIGIHLGSATFGRHSPKQVFHRGWSRAYRLRKWGVLRNPRAVPRVVIGESAAVSWQLLRTRDTSGLRGRVSGWRAGRRELAVPAGATNDAIGLLESLRRRRSYRRE